MKPTMIFPALLLAATLPAFAQSSDSAIKKDPGYMSGSSDSGKNGMDSSRGTPTSPTAGRPGTVDNGNPTGGGATHMSKSHTSKSHQPKSHMSKHKTQ